MTPPTVIIDTDPGLGEPGSVIDDGLAIAFALAIPEIDVLGLTIVNGNVGSSAGYASATALLDRLGRTDIPVRLGADMPLRQDMRTVWQVFGMDAPDAEFSTGQAAPSDRRADAVDWIVEQVAARPGEITVLAIGPMTNIAQAVQADPAFASNVREILVMAGNATGHVENIEVVADFNVLVDPEAMDIVLRSGAPVRMVGIDQTSRVMLTPRDASWLRRIGQDNGITSWLADYVDAWIDHEQCKDDDTGYPACLLHDPLVIAALVRPEFFEFADFEAVVDLKAGELDTSKDQSDEAGPLSSISAAVDIDVDRFHAYFLERLSTL